MQDILTLTEIHRRATAISWPIKDMAARSGVNESTIYRALSQPTNQKVNTLLELAAAVRAREIELRDYLLALHPLQAPANTLEAAE